LLYFNPQLPMRPERIKQVVISTGLVIAMAVTGWLAFNKTKSTSPLPPRNGISASGLNPGSSNPIASSDTRLTFDGKLGEIAAGLVNANDKAGRSQMLARLRELLATGSTNEISQAIRGLLDSKIDAPTGEEFKISDHRFLSQAPTLRTLLLDYLGQIDPAAAAQCARLILADKNSPDEWAVALRDLALGDSSADGHLLLQQKMAELLGYQPWQQNPSVGYLEAFDVAVYLGGTSLVPALADMVRQQDNPALANAAYLALDRLIIADPAALLAALLAQPSLMQGREQTRADYFARADVRDSQQRSLVESYLLNPQMSGIELQQFANVFPNGNFMVSNNLLTPKPLMDQPTLAARDAASLQAVQEWLADPRFANIRPQLQTIASRLAGFVQAGAH